MNDYTECPLCEEGDTCDLCDSTGVVDSRAVANYNRERTAILEWESNRYG